MNRDFWKNRKVLITGNNGFKGCWLTKWLDECGAYTCGISLPAEKESVYHRLKFSERHMYYEADIRRKSEIFKIIEEFNPEVVFHLAAQAFVKTAAEYPVETFETNVMGTVTLLEGLRGCSNTKSIVVVTSDKVYENVEQDKYFVEEDKLGGSEPYSASKVCQEMVVMAYKDAYFKDKGIGIATARACNTIGGGDNHFERLIPYLMKSSYEGNKVEIRNPNAIRPWQYIMDTLNGYCILAEKLIEDSYKYSNGYNFGPDEREVYSVGQLVAMVVGKDGEKVENQVKEANILMISSLKSNNELGWKQKCGLHETVRRTRDFYFAYFEGENVNELFEKEVNIDYE